MRRQLDEALICGVVQERLERFSLTLVSFSTGTSEADVSGITSESCIFRGELFVTFVICTWKEVTFGSDDSCIL